MGESRDLPRTYAHVACIAVFDLAVFFVFPFLVVYYLAFIWVMSKKMVIASQ